MKKAMYTTLLCAVIGTAFLAGSWSSHRAGAPAPATARTVLYYVDPMHPAYKSDKPGIAPDCGMELVPVYADGSMGASGGGVPAGTPGSVNVSLEKQQLLGVQVRPVEKVAATHTVRLLGRVAADESRVYRINAGTEGYIREVSGVTTGDHVKKDQLLAAFASPSSYNIIQLYLLNLGSADRIKQKTAEGSVEGQAAPLANANLQQRFDQMVNLGMSTLQMKEIEGTRQVPASIKILAPADGIVLARNVSLDLKFDRGAELYRIADLHRVWILADVFENEAQYLRPGQTVTVSLPQQKRTFPATVSAVHPQFDPATRTLKVRLEAENPDDILRPDMFVDVALPVTSAPTLAVPAEAVLDSGVKQTVFVDRGEGLFEPRQVETGARFGDKVEIKKGLDKGERIVVSGTFLLDSESRMKLAGAGATGHMHDGHGQHPESATEPAPTPNPVAHIHDGHMHQAVAPKGSLLTPVAQAFAMTKDPFCGMDVDMEKAIGAGLTADYQGKRFYFCSLDCKEQFDKNPQRYAAAAPKAEGHDGSHQHDGHQP
ncbi:MAG TPA: efflux RND transporter periplasmic adaptor subunit [Candidatus Acidoferrum sp.]|nr:efflux RND transporter periplasmic adaptor subunit [Candidatus Acidoferrum sp.]